MKRNGSCSFDFYFFPRKRKRQRRKRNINTRNTRKKRRTRSTRSIRVIALRAHRPVTKTLKKKYKKKTNFFYQQWKKFMYKVTLLVTLICTREHLHACPFSQQTKQKKETFRRSIVQRRLMNAVAHSCALPYTRARSCASHRLTGGRSHPMAIWKKRNVNSVHTKKIKTDHDK